MKGNKENKEKNWHHQREQTKKVQTRLSYREGGELEEEDLR